MNSEIGDIVYYEILQGFVIPCKVTQVSTVYELTDKYQRENGLSSTTAWAYTYEDGTNSATAYKDETLDKPNNLWGFTKLPYNEVLENGNKVNQFVDLDEPIGHSVQIGDEIFNTLEEALAHAGTVDKRQAKRAHKKVQGWRDRVVASINTSHVAAGDPPGCPPYNEKKRIYTKVGLGQNLYNFRSMRRT